MTAALTAVLAAETTKIRTVRSTVWTLLLTFATLPLRGALFAAVANPQIMVAIQALDGIAKGDRVLVHGLTALGNVTNTAARLTSIARGREIIVDTETYAAVAELYPEAEPRELELKGKRAPVKSYTIQAE